MQLLKLNACAACFTHGVSKKLLDMAQPFFAQQLGVAACDEAAFALHGLDKPLGFELCVGALGGDHADAQVARQCADRGKLLALLQLAGKDEVFHLHDNLLVDGLVACVGDDDVQ